MALGTSLAADLEAVFASMPASPADAADALATAYDTYCAGALFGASAPVLTGRKATMAGTLAGGMVVPGAAATFAGAWATAVGAYWTAVTVAGTQAGVCPACPGAAALAGSLAAIFANLANTAGSCAASLATALDGATRTCTATVSPPPGTVLPIA